VIALAVTDGYLDAFNWLVDGVLTNAQSAYVAILGSLAASLLLVTRWRCSMTEEN
jgi:hypothetical protein